jgi:membrane-bound acyltransferase YfiQ involved in biofilm formation
MDAVVMGLLLSFFTALALSSAEFFGLHASLPYEKFLETIPWVIFVVLAVDIYIKYRRVGEWRVFLRKHWVDLLMIALIPFFMVFKFVKLSLKIYKALKITKTGAKILHAVKKLKAPTKARVKV